MAVSWNFWNAVEQLKLDQIEQFAEIFTLSVSQKDSQQYSRESCLSSIEEIVDAVLDNLANGNTPVLRIPKKSTSKDETRGGEELVSFGNPKSCRRFAQMMDLLSKSYVLTSSNSLATRRDLFYENVHLYEKQLYIDKALEDASKLLSVPRRELHITATGKGLIAGHLTYVTCDGTTVQVDESRQGMLIPGDVKELQSVSSDARFILVVEKDATFQRLLEAHLLRTLGPCILVTGKGYPDLCTRQMVHRLWAELHIPVLALVDGDPFGLHIAAVYKFGALARVEPDLRINGLALLGILPSELQGLKLPPKSLMPLTPRDYGKLSSLKTHPALKEKTSWLHQIECLQDLGMKAEIESLTHISQEFLSRIYLPTKISSGSWII